MFSMLEIALVAFVLFVPAYAEDHYKGNAKKASLTTDAKWIQEAVARHNYYRAKHGVPNLEYSENLSQIAQAWANKLAARKGFSHSGNQGLGENLAMQGSTQAFTIQSEYPVDQWYDEVKDYDFATGNPKNNNGMIGHFTQVVWKDTREVGIAYAKYQHKGFTNYVVVANYYPPGNYIGRYKENVLPS